MTNCKKIYLLNDDDLDNLYSYEANSSYGPATYYTKEDIVRCACEKYKVAQEQLDVTLKTMIDNKTMEKERKKMTNEQKKNNEKKMRMNELENKLKKAGLELRNDSKLCDNYIEGTIKIKIDDVVERMCQVKYLYEYCHMEKCKNKAYNDQIKELNAGYFPDCSVFDQAEDIALSKYSNGKYPEKYPWHN